MKKSVILLALFGIFAGCSTPEIDKEIQQNVPALYPTTPDTIVKSNLNGSSDIDLVIQGYYELKIINCDNAFISLTNPRKEIVYFSGATNGLTYQFFNR